MAPVKSGLLRYLFVVWKFMKAFSEAFTASMEASITSMKASTKATEIVQVAPGLIARVGTRSSK